MLESLGAGLSHGVLYAYARRRQDPICTNVILLAVVITLLFLLKYNYWLLIMFGLCAVDFLRQPQTW